MGNYHKIVDHYAAKLAEHGDTHLGMDWPNEADLYTRYGIMLDIVPPHYPSTLLDFGCGTAMMHGCIDTYRYPVLSYSGLDISASAIEIARSKFPDTDFFCADVLAGDEFPTFDYIVMNGVLTEKCSLDWTDMWAYAKRLIALVFEHTNKGLAFNVMSSHVDWERDDLFHVPFDHMATFIRDEISRDFLFRQDYGLYEYTTSVYRKGGIWLK